MAERVATDDRLTPEMIEIVGRVDVAVVATADAGGECDSSLRAGPPGFVQVLDERRIAYPEYRGNGVLASLGNLHENPHVGVLMVDFAGSRRLQVSGSTDVVADDALRAEHPDLPVDAVPGRRTDTWVVVAVEEAAIEAWGDAPRLEPVERVRAWGTDASAPKGGDFFGVAAASALPEPRPAAPEESLVSEDSARRQRWDLRWVSAALAVLVVGLVVALVVVLTAGTGTPTAAPTGPTGPPTLYGRVVDVPDPATVVVDVGGEAVTVGVLGTDASTIPGCAAPGALAFAHRTLDRQQVTLVPDPTVAPTAVRQAYVVLASQLSYTDALIRAGWAMPSGSSLYRSGFDEGSRTARDAELGQFGPDCGN